MKGGRVYPRALAPVDADALASWRALLPVGTKLYPVHRSALRAVAFVFASGGEVRPVPPGAGVAAGFQYSRKHRAFRLRSGETPHHIARAIGLLIHSREAAFTQGDPL